MTQRRTSIWFARVRGGAVFVATGNRWEIAVVDGRIDHAQIRESTTTSTPKHTKTREAIDPDTRCPEGST